jgi:hypothetical protein
MLKDTAQGWKGRRIYVLAAWASPLAAVVFIVVFWLWGVNHEGKRGERPPAALLFYLLLLSASAGGGLAGVISLFGIRSWRHALCILPGALLGIFLNGCVALFCYLGYRLEGVNPGG